MSFYFPRQKIYITVPYKNGATSALNFFVSVEKLLESKNAYIQEIDSFEDLNLNHGFEVHAKSGNFSAEPYRALATRKNLKEAEIRFFIIRDPHKRFSSFWRSHLVSGYDEFFYKNHRELSGKFNLDVPFEEQKAAFQFINEIATPLNRNILNGHLWPQSYLIKNKLYDLIIETEYLAMLPNILSEKSNSYRSFRNLIIPKLNEGQSNQTPLDWNQDMLSKFRKIYKADLNLYKNVISKNPNTTVEIRVMMEDTIKSLGSYEKFLICARNLAKLIASFFRY